MIDLAAIIHPVLGVPAEEVAPGVYLARRRRHHQWLYWIDFGIGYSGAVRTPSKAQAIETAKKVGDIRLAEYLLVLVSQYEWPTWG